MAAGGKRRNLELRDFEKIAEDSDIGDWRKIVENAKEALGHWRRIAEKNKVPEKQIKIIYERISENLNRV